MDDYSCLITGNFPDSKDFALMTRFIASKHRIFHTMCLSINYNFIIERNTIYSLAKGTPL